MMIVSVVADWSGWKKMYLVHYGFITVSYSQPHSRDDFTTSRESRRSLSRQTASPSISSKQASLHVRRSPSSPVAEFIYFPCIRWWFAVDQPAIGEFNAGWEQTTTTTGPGFIRLHPNLSGIVASRIILDRNIILKCPQFRIDRGQHLIEWVLWNCGGGGDKLTAGWLGLACLDGMVHHRSIT